MHKTDCIWTEPDRCNCGWLQEIAKNPRRVDDEIERLRAELAECIVLLDQACTALKYHREQTRPIHQSDEAIAAIDAARKGEGE